MAKKIASNPSDYKICEGCSSIVFLNTLVCPNCHAYRFNVDKKDIIDQATLLGSREQQSVTSDDLL